MGRGRQSWRAFRPISTCMKTTTQSGQAWWGYERALGYIINKMK